MDNSKKGTESNCEATKTDGLYSAIVNAEKNKMFETSVQDFANKMMDECLKIQEDPDLNIYYRIPHKFLLTVEDLQLKKAQYIKCNYPETSKKIAALENEMKGLFLSMKIEFDEKKERLFKLQKDLAIINDKLQNKEDIKSSGIYTYDEVFKLLKDQRSEMITTVNLWKSKYEAVLSRQQNLIKESDELQKNSLHSHNLYWENRERELLYKIASLEKAVKEINTKYQNLLKSKKPKKK